MCGLLFILGFAFNHVLSECDLLSFVFFYNFILINIRFGLSHRIVVGCNYLTKGRGEGEYRNEMRDN